MPKTWPGRASNPTWPIFVQSGQDALNQAQYAGLGLQMTKTRPQNFHQNKRNKVNQKSLINESKYH